MGLSGSDPGPQVQLFASQLVGSKSSTTCCSRPRKKAVGTLKVTATAAVSLAKSEGWPAVDSLLTRAVPELEALAGGEPIDMVWLLGMASRARSLKVPPAQATAATRGRASSVRMSFISLAGDGPLRSPLWTQPGA